MEEKDKNEIITRDDKYNQKLNALVDEAIDIEDPDHLNNIIAMFNQNIAKKNMARIVKNIGILDSATDEALKRVLNSPEKISDKDLIAYINVFQKANDGYTNTLNGVSSQPTIQVNQNNISLDNSPKFTEESSKKILDIINSLMVQPTKEEQQLDEVEIVDEEETLNDK